jgi:hypothetical protein
VKRPSLFDDFNIVRPVTTWGIGGRIKTLEPEKVYGSDDNHQVSWVHKINRFIRKGDCYREPYRIAPNHICSPGGEAVSWGRASSRDSRTGAVAQGYIMRGEGKVQQGMSSCSCESRCTARGYCARMLRDQLPGSASKISQHCEDGAQGCNTPFPRKVSSSRRADHFLRKRGVA